MPEASDAEMMRELYEPMKAWYHAAPQAAVAAEHGPFPSTFEGLELWGQFQGVTAKFLGAELPAVVEEIAEPPRKRRSRFRDVLATDARPARGAGDAATAANANAGALALYGGDGAMAVHQASQLALVAHHASGAPRAPMTHEMQQELLVLQMKLRTLQEKQMNFDTEFQKWLTDPNRAKDPAPIYGPDGKRANTPDVVFRQLLMRERAELLAGIARIQPQTAASLGDAPKRPVRKLYIPVREFPNVCFMGLILGPRGNHHKRMERETLCKIRIRGRGSLREGSRGKDAQRDNDDDRDDLHVFVEGPSEENVQRACEMIEPLLNPESKAVDDLKELHQNELAEINGTQRVEVFCHICGEKGHQQWECPAKQRSYSMANVRCATCGDTSHPTRDCTAGKREAEPGADAGATQAAQTKVNAEFLDFMSELGEQPGLGFAGKPGAPQARAGAAPYNPFAAAQGGAPPMPPPQQQ